MNKKNRLGVKRKSYKVAPVSIDTESPSIHTSPSTHSPIDGSDNVPPSTVPTLGEPPEDQLPFVKAASGKEECMGDKLQSVTCLADARLLLEEEFGNVVSDLSPSLAECYAGETDFLRSLKESLKGISIQGKADLKDLLASSNAWDFTPGGQNDCHNIRLLCQIVKNEGMSTSHFKMSEYYRFREELSRRQAVKHHIDRILMGALARAEDQIEQDASDLASLRNIKLTSSLRTDVALSQSVPRTESDLISKAPRSSLELLLSIAETSKGVDAASALKDQSFRLACSAPPFVSSSSVSETEIIQSKGTNGIPLVFDSLQQLLEERYSANKAWHEKLLESASIIMQRSLR